MTRRVHIDRLDLDMTGITPATAAAAVRLLGPALERALGQAKAAAGGDAGRIEATARTDAPTLAGEMAGRLAQKIGGKR